MTYRFAWRLEHVLLSALALALFTEGLQFFAIDRHPRLADVGIDLAGAGLGLLVVKTSHSALLSFLKRHE